MTDEPISLVPCDPERAWKANGPTLKHVRVMHCLAEGMTWERTASTCEVSTTQISRWMQLTPMREEIAVIREEIRETQEPQFQHTIDLAQQIMIGALEGRFKPNDKRVELAERVLARTLYRIIAMEARGSGRNVPTDPPDLRLSAG